MPQPLISSHRLLLAVAGLLFLNSLITPGFAQTPARWLRVAVDTVLAPARGPLHALAISLRSEPAEPEPPFNTPTDMERAFELSLIENDRLRLQIQELERMLEFMADFRTMTEWPDARPVIVRVNSVTRTVDGPILTLDSGRDAGLAEGMTVVWRTTVIGRVIEPVGPRTAQVQLITGHDGTLQAMVKPALGEGLATGSAQRVRLQTGDDGLSFYADVEYSLPVSVGDLVQLADELQYADALAWPVGRVASIQEYAPDPLMRKRLVIRPDIDPRRVPEVAVLVPSLEGGR